MLIAEGTAALRRFHQRLARNRAPRALADDAIEEYARRITIRWPASEHGVQTFVRDLQRHAAAVSRRQMRGLRAVRVTGAAQAELTLGEEVVGAPHAGAARSA